MHHYGGRATGEYASLLQQDFILMVEVMDVEPQLWRRFKVSGAVNLSALQDRIIQPVMGWCRQYHSHFVSTKQTITLDP